MAESLDLQGLLLQVPLLVGALFVLYRFWIELQKDREARERVLRDIYENIFEKNAKRQEGAVEAILSEIKTSTLVLLELQRQLAAHDLTVTGINPSLGKTNDERESKAFQKFSEFNLSLVNLERTIKNSKRDKNGSE